jgi:hypothetical protein
VSFRVTSIVFDAVDDDTKELVCLLAKETLAGKAAIGSENVNCTSKAGSMIVETEVNAPGGWSQKKLDSAVQSRMLSEDTRVEMEEMLSEVDGLQEASDGEMVFEEVQGARSDIEDATTTASPQSNGNGASPTPSGSSSPSPSPSTPASPGTEGDEGTEASVAAPFSLLPSLVLTLVSVGTTMPIANTI